MMYSNTTEDAFNASEFNSSIGGFRDAAGTPYITITLTTLQVLLSLFFTLLVTTTITNSQKLTNIINLLVVTESIFNLLPGAIVPTLISLRWSIGAEYEKIYCSVKSSCLGLSMVITIYIFFVIGLVRWLKVCMWISFETTAKNMAAFIFPGIFIGSVAAVNRYQASSSVFCNLSHKLEDGITKNFSVIFVLTFSVVFLLSMLMSCHMMYTVWKHRLRIHPIISNRERQLSSKIEVVTSISQVLHLLMFCVTILPLPLLFSSLNPQQKMGKQWLDAFTNFYSFLGTIVDPILYVIFSKEFRNEIRKTFHKIGTFQCAVRIRINQ